MVLAAVDPFIDRQDVAERIAREDQQACGAEFLGKQSRTTRQWPACGPARVPGGALAEVADYSTLVC